MRVLIVGASGFVGKHLIDNLLADGHDVHACGVEPALSIPAVPPGHQHSGIDLLDSGSLRRLLEAARPEWIVHLAAQSSVARSWENPVPTMRINIEGTINLLDAVRHLEMRPRILLVGSSEEYGKVEEAENPIAETRHPAPMNPYAVSKYAQEQLGILYAKAYGMDIILTRSFNHFGPGQGRGFVVPDFCAQIVDIERGLSEPVIRVGNLDVYRDFTDVRDVVDAYRALLHKGVSGEVYNVGSGNDYCIRQILVDLLHLSLKKISYEVSPDKMRPVENIRIQADIGKINTSTGWIPKIGIDATLRDSLDYSRKATR
ncbi:MAG TPA: GDP-mannose 4,6-dehydratase [bacterium]|nr:GDP-mannose 4,6-dehydratase [bacterium]